jgi:hypothetical protein
MFTTQVRCSTSTLRTTVLRAIAATPPFSTQLGEPRQRFSAFVVDGPLEAAKHA